MKNFVLFITCLIGFTLQAQKIQLLPPKELFAETYAVVVGVADYKDNRVGDLNYSDDDAYQFYATLINPSGWNVPKQNIILLIDEQATKNNILTALRRVVSVARSNDKILFYFAGHGEKGGLLPSDLNSYTGANFLKHFELKTVLTQAKTPYKFCFVDACESGAVTDALYIGGVSDLLYGHYNSGIAMMLASGKKEKSLELGNIRQGIFTHFLIRGLEGEANFYQDKVITIYELFSFVYHNVRQLTHNKQNPEISGDYNKFSIVKRLR